MIGILGGSFDPIHNGHLQIADYLTETLNFAELRFLPCGQHAFGKNLQANKTDRLAMLRLSIQTNPKFSIDLTEINNPATSYTIDTLKLLRTQLNPSTSLAWIVGMDAFLTLPQWKDWQALLNYCHLIVVPREHEITNFSKPLKDFIAEYIITNTAELTEFAHGKIYFADSPLLDYSSTQIREAINNHKFFDNYLPNSVVNYIIQHKLYNFEAVMDKNLSYVVNNTPIDINEFSSLSDLFEKSCQRFAKLPAYSNMGKTLSYAETRAKAEDFAAYLQQTLKLKKGDRLAIMLPNTLQYPIALFGAWLAGLIVVNVNPLYTARELKHQLNDAGADTIIILENFAHILAEVIQDTPIKHTILSHIGDLLPAFKASMINFAVKHIKHMVPKFKLTNTLQFKDILKAGAALKFSAVELTHADLALLQYTGGTTGVAKGAALSHGNMVANLLQSYACIPLKEGKELTITALPLYHIFSLMVNCLLQLRIGAHNMLITNPRDIKGFVKEIMKIPFTLITGVNTLFNGLIQNKDFVKLDFSKLRTVVGGGAAVQQAVADKWFTVTKTRLLMGYGLTEASPVVALEPASEKEFTGTIGLPIAATAVSIRDETGEIVPRGERGELCVKGPQVMQGYWQQPEETKEVMFADGWLRTGDIACIETNDYIRIVDRKKDMILVSGFNVYPNEIEDVLALHPDIQEVACIGVPDEHTGEAVKVFIVPKPGTNLTSAEVRRYCKENLTGYKIPRSVEFRDSLPKSNVGKILRRELRDESLAES